jgi:hypothetical protein
LHRSKGGALQQYSSSPPLICRPLAPAFPLCTGTPNRAAPSSLERPDRPERRASSLLRSPGSSTAPSATPSAGPADGAPLLKRRERGGEERVGSAQTAAPRCCNQPPRRGGRRRLRLHVLTGGRVGAAADLQGPRACAITRLTFAGAGSLR